MSSRQPVTGGAAESDEAVGLLSGLNVIEVSLLEPSTVGQILADLGANVIKVEAPGEGDYARRVAWPFVHGISLLHLHVNRGKRSIALDLKSTAGIEIFLDLIRIADVLFLGMRPAALARRGLEFERLLGVNPSLVQCTLSGYGASGPYQNLPSHGVAFDAWAGLATPAYDTLGRSFIPDHTNVGTKVGPIWSALGILAAVHRSRATGTGCQIEVAQSEAAAALNWLRIEGTRAYRRDPTEVTGNPADGGVRREPGVMGMREAVRYQYYRTADGHLLFMASERHFWERFCDRVGRPDLYRSRAGGEVGDHAVGDDDLRAELQAIFEQHVTAWWVQFGIDADVPIAPVNDVESLTDDPQFEARISWLGQDDFGVEMMPSPVRLVGAHLPPPPRPAPTVGQHTSEILRDELGYSLERIQELRALGVD
jgi:crotonobetainyl-CoA:carnitine CoA-transferase CaiB-like acyl-CoA transferase